MKCSDLKEKGSVSHFFFRIKLLKCKEKMLQRCALKSSKRYWWEVADMDDLKKDDRRQIFALSFEKNILVEV